MIISSQVLIANMRFIEIHISPHDVFVSPPMTNKCMFADLNNTLAFLDVNTPTDQITLAYHSMLKFA